MTILIDTMRNDMALVGCKVGGWECQRCKGTREVPVADGSERGMARCPVCNGHGHLKYHYVGRAMPRQGVKASALGNPYKVGECRRSYGGVMERYTAATALEDYEKRARDFAPSSFNDECDEPSDFNDALDNIRGDLKAGRTVVLVCWCAKCQREPYDNPADHDDGCHADVIAKLVKEEVA
jgi:hypothetical protein